MTDIRGTRKIDMKNRYHHCKPKVRFPGFSQNEGRRNNVPYTLALQTRGPGWAKMGRGRGDVVWFGLVWRIDRAYAGELVGYLLGRNSVFLMDKEWLLVRMARHGHHLSI